MSMTEQATVAATPLVVAATRRQSDVWTDERLAKLRRMFADNNSAAEIARELGCFAHCRDGGRSAVCGKLNRLGLVRGLKQDKQAKALRKMRLAKPKADIHANEEERMSRAQSALEATELPADQSPHAVTFAKLRNHHCRWPMGSPGTDDFRFCGDQRHDKLPYCARHARIAYARA